MSRDKDPECRGFLVAESAAAICVTKQIPASGGHTKSWWIPRSQIGYLRKTRREDGAVEIVFTVPEWLLEKKQCWELVP